MDFIKVKHFALQKKFKEKPRLEENTCKMYDNDYYWDYITHSHSTEKTKHKTEPIKFGGKI